MAERPAAVGISTARVYAAPARRRSKAQRPVTSPYEDLPPYLQDNNFILKGYRIDYSLKDTFRSLFRLHNETGNVWTHLLGFLVFLLLTVVTIRAVPAPLSHASEAVDWLHSHLPDTIWAQTPGNASLAPAVPGEGAASAGSYLQGLRDQVTSLLQGCNLRALHKARALVERFGEDQLTALASLESRARELGRIDMTGIARALAAALQVPWPTTRWPLHVFTSGACTCLLLSSFCHLMGCCSFHNSQAIWRLDYAGIVILIVASFIPAVYYSFLCQAHLRTFYIAVTAVLGAATTCVSLMSFFQAKRFRPFRASLFIAFGGWGVVPAVHAAILHWGNWYMMHALKHSIVMGVVYVGGALVYATRVPERWKPGAFDLMFHSHQLFHVAIIIAALVHYRGLRVLVAWRDAQGGCSSPSYPNLSLPPRLEASLLNNTAIL